MFICCYIFLVEFFKGIDLFFFVEMVEYMKIIVNEKGYFEIEECNLFFVVYKNVIGVRRVLWCVFLSLEKN